MRLLPWRILNGARSFHTGQLLYCTAKVKADKQLLSRLRKKTGFPFIKCREALEKFDNDVKAAEKWMKEMALAQGWATAGRLAARAMSQGVIGVFSTNECAVMVEVNCETDFVARNEKFLGLVSTITDACLHHGLKSTVDGNQLQLELSRPEIESLNSKQGSSEKISDLVAMQIGSIGENMAVRRAGFIRASHDRGIGIAHYCHTVGDDSGPRCNYGKYGSLLLFESKAPGDRNVIDCARNVCQHIVGMNPQRIGTKDDKPRRNIDDETLLIYQPYLMNEEVTVKTFVEPHLWPLSFFRYKCGESLSTDDD